MLEFKLFVLQMIILCRDHLNKVERIYLLMRRIRTYRPVDDA